MKVTTISHYGDMLVIPLRINNNKFDNKFDLFKNIN